MTCYTLLFWLDELACIALYGFTPPNSHIKAMCVCVYVESEKQSAGTPKLQIQSNLRMIQVVEVVIFQYKHQSLGEVHRSSVFIPLFPGLWESDHSHRSLVFE